MRDMERVGPWIEFKCGNGKIENVYAPLINGILDVDDGCVTMVVVGVTAESYKEVYYVKESYSDVFRRIAEVLRC